MTAAHLILVWEQRDDPNLLHHAQRAKEVGRNPRIEEYAAQFGPSASYYAWEAAGGPAPGVRGARSAPRSGQGGAGGGAAHPAPPPGTGPRGGAPRGAAAPGAGGGAGSPSAG